MANYKRTGRVVANNFEVVKKCGKYGVATINGSLICSIKYLQIKPFVDGLASVKRRKNIFSKVQWGVIDVYGFETLFPGEYADIVVLNRDLIAVQEKTKKARKGRWGLLDKYGRVICKPKYDECPGYVIPNEFWKASIDDLFTLIDSSGHQICKAKYDKIYLGEFE